MNNKNHEKIWKKIKPFIESIEAFMGLMELKAGDDEKENYRLVNAKRQFIRGIIFAESEKYVSEKKPSKEGYVIDYYAVVYCYEKMFKRNIKKNKKENPDIRVPSDDEIHKEAKEWAFLGVHPQITETAKRSYKKGVAECMTELAKLCKDKSLDFDAPAKQFIKKIFKGIFN